MGLSSKITAYFVSYWARSRVLACQCCLVCMQLVSMAVSLREALSSDFAVVFLSERQDSFTLFGGEGSVVRQMIIVE